MGADAISDGEAHTGLTVRVFFSDFIRNSRLAVFDDTLKSRTAVFCDTFFDYAKRLLQKCFFFNIVFSFRYVHDILRRSFGGFMFVRILIRF